MDYQQHKGTAMDDKIMGRIRKLLAVANDNAAGGEHERDTAMKMVLNLLAKHNLSMSEVGSTSNQPQENRIKAEEVYYDYGWMRIMAGAIAKLYFCTVFTSKTGKKDRSTFTFIGLESNVITAKEMFDYISKSVTREASRVTTAARENQTFKWSFCKGAADRIYRRCADLRREAENENQAEVKAQATSGSTSTALVLASLYESEDKANRALISQQLGITLKTRTSTTRNTRGDGFRQGQTFGNSVGLNKQVA